MRQGPPEGRAHQGVTVGRGPLAPQLLFVVAAVSQYLGAALAVLLFARVQAGGVALLRVAGAAVVLVLWRRPTVRRSPREWALVAAFGTALACMNLSFYLAIDRIPVGTAVAIEFAGPVAVAALGSRRSRDWAALALAVAGVVLVADVHVTHSSLGVVFAGAAAVLWAAYIVLGHRVAASSVDGLDSLAAAMVIGALVILAPEAGPAAGAFADPLLLAAVIGVGLMSSVVPYGIDQITLRRMPRHRYAMSLALLPATAAVVGIVVLGQSPSVTEAAGIVLVMGSVLLASQSMTGP